MTSEILDDDIPLDPSFATRFDTKDRRPACQLYLISPPVIDAVFADKLAAALDAGKVAAFQLRLKGVSDEAILKAAETLIPICAVRDVAFILNDRMDLAQECGADGVHLGQGDGDAREARKLLGPSAQIGVTCHDSRHLAMEAGEAGADYVAFGAFYPTTTKETTHRPDPSILSWWTTVFGLPCVAIGGITADNAKPLVDAGADFIAVSSAVWNHEEGAAAGVRAFGAVLPLATRAPKG
ncbi:thiamine phosphate synthase [Rhizorhapis sp. SPR117]|uniref:thiamine phosphate synthase n=1 Tax=Rhizorhapis sp. SPR117 TaxID=2912611 RepID=UPI001F00CC33|nr:thiamine phosphate synthase [Rhizorhapis sp. SPR117]